MKIVVCDDEILIINQVVQIIREYEKEVNTSFDVVTFSDIKDLEEDSNENGSYDMIFMDVEIGNDNGIVEAERLMKTNPLIIIVFMTGYEQYVMEAFRARPLGFLGKPLDKSKVKKYIKSAYELLGVQSKFNYKKRGIEYKIITNEIYYAESAGRKVRIHSRNVEDEFYDKLDNVEKQLAAQDKNFLRINQSFLINARYVMAKEKNRIYLQTGTERIGLDISRAYEKSVNQWYVGCMMS